jgi:hypothetical protein
MLNRCRRLNKVAGRQQIDYEDFLCELCAIPSRSLRLKALTREFEKRYKPEAVIGKTDLSAH